MGELSVPPGGPGAMPGGPGAMPDGPPTAPGPPPAPVPAVVVNYNSGAYLASCVESLVAGGVGEIVVVDNSSTDGSVALMDERVGAGRARAVHAGANLGYGAAVNLGLSRLAPPGPAGGFVVICNPDVEMKASCLRSLVKALGADQRLAIVGPKLLRTDGTAYPSARRFPSLAGAALHGFAGLLRPGNRFSRHYKMVGVAGRGYQEVDWVSGALFAARRRALAEVGGFDPAYFMYLEDVDLCWRLRERGFAVGYEPGAVAVHAQGVSTAQHPYRMIIEHHRSLARFARQHGASGGSLRPALLPVVLTGIGTRAALACAAQALQDRGAAAASRAAGRSGSSSG
ncbi:MAG: glycosyltransferase family 2 protein [Acidimicrobiales bacterium]